MRYPSISDRSVHINVTYFCYFICVVWLDICVRISEEVDQLSNQLFLATFFLPQCQLLFGQGVNYDTKRTCQNLLESIVDNEQGFGQGKRNKHRKSNASKKVYVSYVPFICNPKSCSAAKL